LFVIFLFIVSLVERIKAQKQSYASPASMKLLPIALPSIIACLCSNIVLAAYLSIEDHSNPWTSFHDIALAENEGLLLTLPVHDPDSHYLCDVVIGNHEAFQISVHSESPDNWIATPMVERSLAQEYVTLLNEHIKTTAGRSDHGRATSNPSQLAHSLMNNAVAPIITCKRPVNQRSGSVLQQRIGFMHLIDVLSIVGVGFLAATASGIAAWFRRHDHLKRPVAITNYHSYARCRLDHLHERPSMDNHDETEYVFNYIKNKLG
jgi:hypothetical protein